MGEILSPFFVASLQIGPRIAISADMKNKLVATLALCLFTVSAASFADNTETKVKNAASDAKTETKKSVRKGKRKVRKATGNDSVGKDASDAVNDVKDDAGNAAQKMKNKTE